MTFIVSSVHEVASGQWSVKKGIRNGSFPLPVACCLLPVA